MLTARNEEFLTTKVRKTAILDVDGSGSKESKKCNTEDTGTTGDRVGNILHKQLAME